MPSSAVAEPATRQNVLHDIYAPIGRQVLLEAGLKEGMKIADFGCATGTMSRLLASLTGSTGMVIGVDSDESQLAHARESCTRIGLRHMQFVPADPCRTGLPREMFDLVYSRCLLSQLPDPEACLDEMREVLKPGGILVIEEADHASAGSAPAGALDAFAELLGKRAMASRLAPMVAAAGFSRLNIRVHQPADRAGASAMLLKCSVEESGPGLVESGAITAEELARALAGMEIAMTNPEVLAFAPRMTLVWGRKLYQVVSRSRIPIR